MKHCPRCRETKMRSQFYAAGRGLMHICKSCHKERVAISMAQKREREQIQRERSRARRAIRFAHMHDVAHFHAQVQEMQALCGVVRYLWRIHRQATATEHGA
jgi:hypothetical protein